MTIGELLKYYRINQNKTLKEFAGNIIDRSYYGKVEKNIHQISINNLIDLLNYNQINTAEFIEKLNSNYENTQNQLQTQRKLMEEAYYHVDKDRLQKIKIIISESNLSKKDKEIQNLIADGFIELLSPDNPNQKLRDEIKKKIFEIPNFNKTKFMLYCNSMRFYSLSDNKTIVNRLIERYKDDESKIVQKALISIVINILIFSIEENDFENIDYYISFVSNIPTTPDIFFYKNVMEFLTHFIKYKSEKDVSALKLCNLIIRNISITGMPEYAKELSKFKKKHQ
ncbi:helix-turn-helix domain-containing protein [Lactobacillus ultunensis]|uniref:DNA-binding helix-turn-helix protein n=1 Tax=Lactobacillus ultunensis DSM 16047 TaxID=525365 RepID=C2EP09_9LACO|nr:helix-turn-helix domain-containing protein [Lactobacillus ultunensis]EEJ71792.1 DNA-binding helix-turn-helix protein [Lactobacillus ultunensis DSM 16047]KRL79723.1 XRE family transcriptional regulator [Lactobacillus ultunensis DSM 16047]QQP28502.1 helix-turn-helix domain-containing protein [Lactobacillus ultunensis]